MRFAGDAPTLTSALTISAFNTGIGAGSVIAGTALDSSLGLTGSPLVGTVIAAQRTACTHARHDEPAQAPT
ncbi:hypothetical protein GCM10023084_05000 [Streptomyces lacrimifluminis]|uniref:Uncharacterized protein n=1 Tax=Streptomyces lacrimifluminis TaxID=1500077 RepID=A0A917KQC1_9ACTN|nr:hypothetical protein [Streptomyces lacrimifluminis]GGJ22528.1 hypothetical protein GCM10012282_18740 [Streptomyces lacrimifluminis]